MCAELCHFYHIIYGAGYFLTASEKGELGESLLILGVNLQRLRGWSHARGEWRVFLVDKSEGALRTTLSVGSGLD